MSMEQNQKAAIECIIDAVERLVILVQELNPGADFGEIFNDLNGAKEWLGYEQQP